MMGGNRATIRASEGGEGSALTEDVAAAGRRAAGAVGDAANRAAAGVSGTAARVSDSANRTAAGMSDAAARIGDAATRATTSVGGTAATVGKQVSARSRDLVDLCREQPLVMAGIGIALGAAIGAMLPPTDAENRLLGDSSDQLKARTRDLATGAREAVRAEGPRATGDRAPDHGPDPLAARMATASENPDRGGPSPTATKMAAESEPRDEDGSDRTAREMATASEPPGGHGQAAGRGREPDGSA